MERLHLKIFGQVQGVLYRSFCSDIAHDLGLTGWVRNTAEGNVEIIAEGPKESLEKLLNWAKQGSPGAKVDNVEAIWEKPTGEFSTFEIKSLDSRLSPSRLTRQQKTTIVHFVLPKC